MKHLVPIVTALPLSISVSAHDVPAAVFSDTARVPAEHVQDPDTKSCFRYIVSETIAPQSGLSYDDVRVAALLVLVQLGIVSTLRDLGWLRPR